MEVHANAQGQTIIHLSKTEWQEYGRQAGWEDQASTNPQKLSGIIGEILETYQQSNPEWENDDTYKKMAAKADEAKDLLIDIEDPNVDITAKSETKTAQTFLEPNESSCEWCNDGDKVDNKEKCPKCERVGKEDTSKTASTDDGGLIGPFKLRACDEIIERPSRRRRNFQEELTSPFMRSMPYS